MSIKELLERDWERAGTAFFRRHAQDFKVLLISYALQLLVYGQKMVSHSLTVDDYARFYSGKEGQANWNGRWLNEVLSSTVFSGPLHILPYWNFLLGLSFVTLAAFLSTKIFSLKTTFSKFGFIALCTITPFWAENYFFNTNFSVWLFTLVGVYGFYIVIKKEQKKRHWWIGGVLIIAAISVYQVTLILILVLLFFKVLMELLEGETRERIFQVIKENSKYVIFLGLCFLLYSWLNSFYIQQFSAPVLQGSQYSSFSESVHPSAPQTLLKRIASVYVAVTGYLSPYYFDLIASETSSMYLTKDFFHQGRFPSLFIYLIGVLAVLLVTGIKIISSVWETQKNCFKIKLWLLILLFGSLPVIINLPALVGAVLPIRGYYPVGWVLAGCWALSFTGKTFYKNVNLLLFPLFLLFSFYYINVFFYWAYRQTESDIRLADQIVGVIRTQPGYEDEEEPLNFWVEGTKNFHFTGWDWGVINQASSNPRSKYRVFQHFTDLNFRPMDDSQYQKIVEKLIAGGKEIYSYPSKNAIYVDERDVVLFLRVDKINEKIRKGKP